MISRPSEANCNPLKALTDTNLHITLQEDLI